MEKFRCPKTWPLDPSRSIGPKPNSNQLQSNGRYCFFKTRLNLVFPRTPLFWNRPGTARAPLAMRLDCCYGLNLTNVPSN